MPPLPAGDYGSMVNERVGASNWEDGDELGNTWVSRNAFRWACHACAFVAGQKRWIFRSTRPGNMR